MATLDTLPPDRRAIIELLLRQGQGYDDLAATLDMPSARVRELAREALASLAPATARRVDEEWRDQVADYVLGQQTGPEAKATRGHLKRSEPARAWVGSLLDSLDPLYGDGARPDIPDPDGGSASESRRRRSGAGASAPERSRGRGRAAAGAAGAAAGATAAEAAESDGEDGGDGAQGRDGAATSGTARSREDMSPEARSIVRRRRIIAGAVAALLLAAAIVLPIALSGGGGGKARRPSSGGSGQTSATSGAAAGQSRAQLVGQAVLRPVGGSKAKGVAVIAQRGGQYQLLVQARGLTPSGKRSAYEVWLYDSPKDAVSLGGQVTDRKGDLQGAGPLPPNFRDYRFVDVSREKIDRNAKHSGNSVLRVPLADLLRGGNPGGAAGGAGAGAPGGVGPGGSAGGGGAP